MKALTNSPPVESPWSLTLEPEQWAFLRRMYNRNIRATKEDQDSAIVSGTRALNMIGHIELFLWNMEAMLVRMEDAERGALRGDPITVTLDPILWEFNLGQVEMGKDYMLRQIKKRIFTPEFAANIQTSLTNCDIILRACKRSGNDS